MHESEIAEGVLLSHRESWSSWWYRNHFPAFWEDSFRLRLSDLTSSGSTTAESVSTNSSDSSSSSLSGGSWISDSEQIEAVDEGRRPALAASARRVSTL